jgi:hypothetical protein
MEILIGVIAAAFLFVLGWMFGHMWDYAHLMNKEEEEFEQRIRQLRSDWRYIRS